MSETVQDILTGLRQLAAARIEQCDALFAEESTWLDEVVAQTRGSFFR
jgi:hypothetical protein